MQAAFRHVGMILVAAVGAGCGGQAGREPPAPSTEQGITVEVVQVAAGDRSTTVRVRFNHSDNLNGVAPAVEPTAISTDGVNVSASIVEFDHVANEAVYSFPDPDIRSLEFSRFLVARDGGAIALLDLQDLIPEDKSEALASREFAVSAEREVVALAGGPVVGAVGLGIWDSQFPNLTFLRLLSLNPFSGARFAVVYSDGAVERGLFIQNARDPVSAEQPNLFQTTVGFRLENHERQLAGYVRLFRGPVLEWLDGNWIVQLHE